MRSLSTVIVSFSALVSIAGAGSAIAQQAIEHLQPKLEWFEGLGDPGRCVVLPANQAFVEKNLSGGSKSERRVALVIGNSAYAKPKWALPNPRTDAVGVARLLQSVGFDVHLIADGGQAASSACAAQAAAQPADIAIAYYSGHALQREYTNYLVATDMTRLDGSLAGLVSLDDLITRFRQSSGKLLVFLDACRNNPLSSVGGAVGLAPEKVVPRSVTAMPSSKQGEGAGRQGLENAASLTGGELFVAFSTSPNSVADDGKGHFSPFTAAFLRHATKPGWSIQRVIAEVTKSVGEGSDWRQTPWSRSSLTGQIFLNGGVDPQDALRASRLKAKQSRELLGTGDRIGAIIEALRGLPEELTQDDIERYPEAYEALYRAVRSRSMRLPVSGAVHASFSPTGDRATTVSAEVGEGTRREALKLWELGTGRLIAELLPLDRSGTVGSTAGPAVFSSDGRRVMHIDPVAMRPVVWDAATGAVLAELPRIPGESPPMVVPPRRQFSSSGRFALINGTGGTHLYDIEARRIRWSLKSGAGLIAAAISPDDTLLATATATGSRNGGEYQAIEISAFDIATKKKLWTKSIKEPGWGAYSAGFSPDGKSIGVTTSSYVTLVLDIATANVVRVEAAPAGTGGLGFSPDGRFLATASSDNSNSLPGAYDLQTGQAVQLPFNAAPIPDIIYDASGAEVGAAYYSDVGDMWRRGVEGPELIDAAIATLAPDDLAKVPIDRVRFR
jgi:uncharacterized caspase-like protein